LEVLYKMFKTQYLIKEGFRAIGVITTILSICPHKYITNLRGGL
jgi:hypothetical protein